MKKSSEIKNKCCDTAKSADHSSEIPKINRLIGQLEGIKKMIESNRYCPDILIQFRAVRSAVRAVEGNVLKSHLKSCVVQSFSSEKERAKKIDEIKEIFDRFES